MTHYPLNRLESVLLGVLTAVGALVVMCCFAFISIRAQVLAILFGNPYLELAVGYPLGLLQLRALNYFVTPNDRALLASYASCYAIGWAVLMYVWHLAP